MIFRQTFSSFVTLPGDFPATELAPLSPNTGPRPASPAPTTCPRRPPTSAPFRKKFSGFRVRPRPTRAPPSSRAGRRATCRRTASSGRRFRLPIPTQRLEGLLTAASPSQLTPCNSCKCADQISYHSIMKAVQGVLMTHLKALTLEINRAFVESQFSRNFQAIFP